MIHIEYLIKTARLAFFLVLVLNQTNVYAQADTLVIAFGSCNRQSDEQPLWNEILDEDPNIWIWLGDNIYGDSPDMEVIRKKYDTLLTNSDYINLRNKATILGTWDDHDYGINDGGQAFRQKAESQKLALDFLGEPANSQRRSQPGIYDDFVWEKDGLRVKVLLLDTRYHRDTIIRKRGKYLPNKEGTILGKDQWKWLEDQIAENNADLTIIASSIQVISAQHRWEKWANFPEERKRLMDLISKNKSGNVMFISGDRHIAEVSKIESDEIEFPIYDITSSGLTHTWSEARKEKNRFRISPLVIELNYGILRVWKSGEKVNVKGEIKGDNGQMFWSSPLY